MPCPKASPFQQRLSSPAAQRPSAKPASCLWPHPSLQAKSMSSQFYFQNIILFQLLERATLPPPQDPCTCFPFFLLLSPNLLSTLPPVKSTLHRNPSSPVLSKQQFSLCGFNLHALILLRVLITFCDYFVYLLVLILFPTEIFVPRCQGPKLFCSSYKWRHTI